MSDQTIGKSARDAWDDADRHAMPRYAVWHSTGNFDGDSCWHDLHDAEAEFAHQCDRLIVIKVELLDNSTEPPKIIKQFSA